MKKPFKKSIPLFGQFFFTILFVGLCVTRTWATPPRKLQLNYDLGSTTLSIEAAHVSRDLDDHFIRRLVIHVNGEERKSQFFTRQKTKARFAYATSVVAEAGDKIWIKLYCERGGTREASLIVPEEEIILDETPTAIEPEAEFKEEPSDKGSRY